MATTQSTIDSLVDSLMLSASPTFASIKAEVRDRPGRSPLAIVNVALGDVAWALSASTAGTAAVELTQAGVIMRQPALLDVGRRLGRAAVEAFAEAARLEAGVE